MYSFTEKMRNSQFYLYPEVANDFHNKLEDVTNAIQTTIHFLANTETVPSIQWDKLPFDRFNGAVSTAGGLSPLLTAYTAKLQPGDTLVIADISSLSLILQRKQISRHIDLSNLQEEIDSILDETAGDQMLIRPQLRAVENVSRMQEIVNEILDTGLQEYYDNVFTKLNIIYTDVNYLNPFNVKRYHGFFSNSEKVYINISNVYHYQNTGWIYNIKQRYDLEKQMLTLLNTPNDKFYIKNIRHNGGSWQCQSIKNLVENADSLLSLPPFIKEIQWINT